MQWLAGHSVKGSVQAPGPHVLLRANECILLYARAGTHGRDKVVEQVKSRESIMCKRLIMLFVYIQC